jgi:glycerophosphoryl diester phosphodiesterase
MNFPFPAIYAHRGASAHAPENTLAAFQRALADGAQAVEFDVKLSLDGIPIILHDQTLQRTTTGAGRANQMTLSQLKQFDAGVKFGEAFKGERIPTLEETLDQLGPSLLMNIELTNYATPFDELVNKVAALVVKYKMEERVLFSSFLPHNLMHAQKLLPQTPRGQLALPGAAGWWQRLWGRVIDVQAEHPYLKDVTAQSVENAHKRYRRVHVWTVNDPADMRRLKQLAADGIFTDDPALALHYF